jgi:peptide/nickel transport system permease protein
LDVEHPALPESRRMTAYILRRIGISILLLLGISIISFFLVRLIPGDTVTVMLGMRYDEQRAAQLRQRYALDRPIPIQYGIWLGQVVRGDLGDSHYTGRPVGATILDRLPVTLQLAAIALGFALVVGVPLGILSAIRHNRPMDYGASFLGLIGISIPGFWLGTILILLVSLRLGWLPSGGFVSITFDPLANLRHMIMPGLALGTAVAAVVMRMTRSAMLEVIRQDYIRTARAKGQSERVVIVRHALRNALIPVATIVGLQAGYLLGGSVVIEEVFSLPGIGRLVLQAISSRDYLLLQGVVLFIAAAFVIINLIVDLLYAALDPRIRYE